jgi:muconate cycloisomerase
MEMKVTGVQAIVVSIPIRHKGYLGIGSLERVDNVIVVLETDAGVSGFGEASPWPCFADNAWSIKAAIDRYLGPAIVGENPFDVERLLLKMDDVLHDYNFAKSAVEMALLDVSGKSLGVPLYRLLGGKVRDRTTLSYSIANQDIAKDLDEIKWLLDQGLFVFKIKTGVLDFKPEVRRVEAIRKALPVAADMRIDFNQGLKRELAIKTCRAIEAYEPTFIEQPVKGYDIDMMARIADAIDTPLMADESVFSMQNAIDVVKAGAADIASIKIMKPGGILRSRKVAAIFEAVGTPCYAGAMWESGIGIAASLHFMASTPNVRYGSDYYIPNYLLLDDMIVDSLRVSDGYIYVPEEPGLGVELDWKAVEKYRVA